MSLVPFRGHSAGNRQSKIANQKSKIGNPRPQSKIGNQKSKMITTILGILAALIPFAIWLWKSHAATQDDPWQQHENHETNANRNFNAKAQGRKDARNLNPLCVLASSRLCVKCRPLLPLSRYPSVSIRDIRG